jgi:hypothetical protein
MARPMERPMADSGGRRRRRGRWWIVLIRHGRGRGQWRFAEIRHDRGQGRWRFVQIHHFAKADGGLSGSATAADEDVGGFSESATASDEANGGLSRSAVAGDEAEKGPCPEQPAARLIGRSWPARSTARLARAAWDEADGGSRPTWLRTRPTADRGQSGLGRGRQRITADAALEGGGSRPAWLGQGQRRIAAGAAHDEADGG